MDVILHLGAHGTATRRFHGYVEAVAPHGTTAPFAFRGPDVAAAHVSDLGGDAEPALAADLSRLRADGCERVLFSDADFLGTLTRNLEDGLLYPDAEVRATRLACVFGPALRRIVLSTRSLDLYWCGAVANGVVKGAAVPDRSRLHAMAISERSWRDVITDLSGALPDVDIRVLPFESFAGQPHRFLACAVDVDAPRRGTCAPAEAAPLLPELRRVLRERGQDVSGLPFGMGRWNPFTNEEHAAMRERYADDMMWLTAGADGRATLIEDREETRAGQTLPSLAWNKGRNNELEERQMARPG